jgi:hypothetical protein
MLADSTSEGEAAQQMRSIQRSHFGRGWAGVGYHYVIDPAGRIWEGRPITFQGAHAGSSELNRGNVGVSLMGDFDQQHVPAAQLDACRRLIVQLCAKYGVSPNEIRGHSDLKQTACPGAHLSALLPQLMPGAAAIATARGGGGRVPETIAAFGGPRFHTVVRGDTLSAIARRYGVSLSALRRANPGAGNGLFPGNLIAVP